MNGTNTSEIPQQTVTGGVPWASLDTDSPAYQESLRVIREELPKGQPTHSTKDDWRKPQARNDSEAALSANILSELESIWDYEPTATDWVHEPLAALSGVTLLAAPEGLYKTWLALCLANAVSHGGQFLGRDCRPRRVIYCDRENHVSLIRQRIDDLGFTKTLNFTYWGMNCKTPPPMLESVRFYVELVESIHPRPLLIFDSLVRFHAAESENSAADMAPVMASLRAIATAGASVLVLHHRGKSTESNYRGSSDIGAGVDIAMRLIQETEGTLTLKSSKTRYGTPWGMTLRFDLLAGGFASISDPGLEKAKSEFSEIAEYIRSHPGASKGEVEVEFKGKLTQSRAREIMLAGLERGEWKLKIGERGRKELFPSNTPRSIETESEV